MINDSDNRKIIIETLAERIKFCVNDSNTFIFAKTNKDAKRYADAGLIGGGNFIVLLATFACLDLLSYINSILNAKKNELWSEDEIKNSKDEKSKLSGNLKKLIRVPEVHEPKTNFLDRLITFLMGTENIHGMNTEQINKFVVIRHKLAHVFSPKYIPAASLPFYGKGDFISLLSAYKNRSVFTLTSDNILGIDSNALVLKLPLFLVYLKEKIKSSSPKKLDIIIKWLKDN